MSCSQCGTSPCLCDAIGIDNNYELTVKVNMRAPTMIKAVTVLKNVLDAYVLDAYVSAGYIQSHSVEEGKQK